MPNKPRDVKPPPAVCPWLAMSSGQDVPAFPCASQTKQPAKVKAAK